MSTCEPMLVADLDGTLIRTDMLHETFWSAFSLDWTTPFKAASSLCSGRAKLKDYLRKHSDVDVTSLPYNDTVIAYLKAFRDNGGRTALVTASNQELAEKIASHIDVFDEVHGSSGSLNLKGKNKAEFLFQHCGEASFIYMGDAHADLPVWQKAHKAVTVDAKPGLRKKVEQINDNHEHLSHATPSIAGYLKAMRPHQWLKNMLVFLPMLAAHQLDISVFLNSLIAFIAFSLVASSVYITNDLFDLNADRAHPRKRKRPFASGTIPIQHGGLLACSLLVIGIIAALVISPAFLLSLCVYYALTSAYSLDIKRRTIIDICTLAGLYTLRIISGGVAADIELSFWLLAFSIFIFLSLAAVKRQAELVDLKERGALSITGRGYHADDLPLITMIAMSAGFMSVLVMALYVNSPAVVSLYPTPSALWGVCCILLYWLSRIVFTTHRGEMYDDPIVFAIKDRISQLCFLLIALLVVFGAVW